MSKVVPLSITVDEAVAAMVNMDYIPTGFSLIDMLEAFEEEAEVNYENASVDRLPEEQITALKISMDLCKARHTLAQLLFNSIQYEIDHQEDAMIVLANDSSSHQRLTFHSVSDWAADKYGISITTLSNDSNTVDENLKKGRWESVTIKIWKDHKIGYSSKKGKFNRAPFREIGLMGKNKIIPNQLGIILVGLSRGKKFPHGTCRGKDKTAISKLRRVLYKLIGFSADPFYPYNQSEGWKPKFILIHDVNNADERAEKQAIHKRFDESKQ